MTLDVPCPASKSMTARALVIAALAEGPTEIARALRCDDMGHLSALLRRLGVTVEWQDESIHVEPAALRSDGKPHLLGNAGTAVRFGCCLALLCDGELVIDGNERMRERPLGPLARALSEIGVAVKHLAEPGFPPVALKRASELGSRVSLDGSVSSQYASGLVMVAPRLPGGLTIDLTGTVVSRPYLQMTVEMVRRAGATVSWETNRIEVRPSRYRTDRIAIETDWSAAAFLMAAGELVGTPVRIANLEAPTGSLQGDAAFPSFAAELRHPPKEGGCRFDLEATPDLIAPLAVLALFASASTTLHGVAHARKKESDRIAVLCRELRKTGATIHELADGLMIEPLRRPAPSPIAFDPAGDHRMAMALGLLSLRLPGVVVGQPDCVAKSFPDFWQVLERFRHL